MTRYYYYLKILTRASNNNNNYALRGNGTATMTGRVRPHPFSFDRLHRGFMSVHNIFVCIHVYTHLHRNITLTSAANDETEAPPQWLRGRRRVASDIIIITINNNNVTSSSRITQSDVRENNNNNYNISFLVLYSGACGRRRRVEECCRPSDRSLPARPERTIRSVSTAGESLRGLYLLPSNAASTKNSYYEYLRFIIMIILYVNIICSYVKRVV